VPEPSCLLTCHLLALPSGLQQEWHWGFYSCSGFTNDVEMSQQAGRWGGANGLWGDVLACHQQRPLHLLVGGGDQLYNDDIFTVRAWVLLLWHCCMLPTTSAVLP
jgi:hypothetical protein